jgi:hypothetical protein
MARKRVIDIVIFLVLLVLLIAIIYMHRTPGPCKIDPVLEKLRRDLIKVDPRLSRLQYFPGDESYTEDKEKIFLCMKDENGKTYPYNTLFGVALHEAAHALTNVVDKEHVTPEFNNMHEHLRQKATKLGLLDPTKPVPAGYCPKH